MQRACDQCSSLYEAESRYLNRGQGLFCSRKCSGEYQSHVRAMIREPNSVCAYCSIPFWRVPSKANRTTMVFCSKEHHALASRHDSAVDFKVGPNPSGTRARCVTCKKSIAGHLTLCRICSKEQKIQCWLRGDLNITRSANNGEPKTFVKEYLIKSRGDACEECGFNKHGPFGSIIQMDHIDGNYLNNSLDNLKLLCPNCHAMTPTYGSRNKSGGRTFRRKVGAGRSSDERDL